MLDPFKEAIKTQKVTKKRMAEMWCELNTYKVPKEFKKELLPFNSGNSDRAAIAMKDIQDLIGLKACLRTWRALYCKDLEAGK